MDYTMINSYFSGGLDQVNGLMDGPLKYIISGILGVVFLVIIIGLIFSVVSVIKNR